MTERGQTAFDGYPRSNGSVGVRNHVLVLSTVGCANGAVTRIAREVPGVVPITHSGGCGTGMLDARLAVRTLAGMGTNPNVHSVLVIGLGCEAAMPALVAMMIAESGKPVEHLIVQERGVAATAAMGVEIARGMLEESARAEKAEAGLSSLVVGLECGGSDAFSGVSANPAVGVAADMLVEHGATVILSETTEMIGADHILAGRAKTPQVADDVLRIVKQTEVVARQLFGDERILAPGNIEGGLTTIEEKSLGCICKGGSSPINEVIDYAEQPTQKGLVVMDTPGYDIESDTGMAAGGAQIIVFTTGRGTPAGCPGVPVIKVVSNSATFGRMGDDIDINAGRILDGDASVEEVGREIFQCVVETANGAETKAERNGECQFGILKRFQSF